MSSNISRRTLFINVAYELLNSYYKQMLILQHKKECSDNNVHIHNLHLPIPSIETVVLIYKVFY